MKGWIVFFIGLLLFACANSKSIRVLYKDLDRVQSRINILQKESKSTKNEVSDMRAKNQELKTDFSLQLDNFESEIRILSTGVEEYKEFVRRVPEEIYRFNEEMTDRLRLEEKRGTQEERFTRIENRLKASDGNRDRQYIRINSLINQ